MHVERDHRRGRCEVEPQRGAVGEEDGGPRPHGKRDGDEGSPEELPHAVVEEREHVLLDPAEHLHRAAVHLDRDHAHRQQEVLAQLPFAHEAAELDVVEHLHRQRLVASHGAIRRGADHVERADAQPMLARSLRAPRPVEREEPDEAAHHAERDEAAACWNLGNEGQVIEALSLAMSYRASNRRGLEDHVGVGEEQVFAAGAQGAAMQRVVLAEPSGR